MENLVSLSYLHLFLLIGAAIIAGYVDTLVGGGGLITIPALLAAGIPPVMALGTNKFQACAGSGTASISLLLKGKIKLGDVRWGMGAAFVGALVGATAVQFADKAVLEVAIPLVIVLILLYFLKPPKVSKRVKPRLSSKIYRSTVVPSIGVYDGALGPATGSFFVLAGVSLRAQGIVQATMTAKAFNFATNLAALLVFIFFGKVAFMIGFLMMLGQFVGASFGARALLSVNPNALRWLVVVMCAIMLSLWVFQNVGSL